MRISRGVIYNPYPTATSTLYTPIITLTLTTANTATTSITELLLHHIISFHQPPIDDNSNIKSHKTPIYTQTILIHLDIFSFFVCYLYTWTIGSELECCKQDDEPAVRRREIARTKTVGWMYI